MFAFYYFQTIWFLGIKKSLTFKIDHSKDSIQGEQLNCVIIGISETITFGKNLKGGLHPYFYDNQKYKSHFLYGRHFPI